eukprot:3181655-Amphidinium_carterae.1
MAHRWRIRLERQGRDATHHTVRVKLLDALPHNGINVVTILAGNEVLHQAPPARGSFTNTSWAYENHILAPVQLLV